MSVTNKQLKANQANSKKGGVKTNKGKEIVKHNAVKHGLLSRELMISKSEREEFDDFKNGIISQLKPVADLEYFLADRIITCAWRLKIALKIERNIILWERDNSNVLAIDGQAQAKREKIINIANNRNLEKVNRYETAIEKRFYRAMGEYRLLKNGFVS